MTEQVEPTLEQPASTEVLKEVTPFTEKDLPLDIQKQITALRHVTTCHNVLTSARHEYNAFDAVASSVHFLQKLYLDLADEIVKCPEAEKISELQPLFSQKRKVEGNAEVTNG